VFKLCSASASTSSSTCTNTFSHHTYHPHLTLVPLALPALVLLHPLHLCSFHCCPLTSPWLLTASNTRPSPSFRPPSPLACPLLDSCTTLVAWLPMPAPPLPLVHASFTGPPHSTPSSRPALLSLPPRSPCPTYLWRPQDVYIQSQKAFPAWTQSHIDKIPPSFVSLPLITAPCVCTIATITNTAKRLVI
jgi:hypothetical protein